MEFSADNTKKESDSDPAWAKKEGSARFFEQKKNN